MGIFGVVEARAITVRHRHLAQDKIGGAVVFVSGFLVKRNKLAALVRQGKHAVGARDTGGDGVAHHGVAPIGAVQLKLCANHGLVVLVVLGDV